MINDFFSATFLLVVPTYRWIICFYKWIRLMIEKEYYQVDELKKLFNVSVEEVRSLVANKKIELVFNLKTHYYIYGNLNENKEFTGHCSGNYSGLVKISFAEQIELLSQEFIQVEYLTILDTRQYIYQHFGYPFETSFPNHFLHKWESKLVDGSGEGVTAKLYSKKLNEYLTPARQMVQNAYETTKEREDNKKDDISSSQNSIIEKTTQKIFHQESIKLTFADSCVLHTDVVRLGYIKSKSEGIASNRRPIDRLLLSMLDNYPDDKPSQLWSKLKNDILNEPRIFDVDEIIDEVGDGQLYWFDNDSEIKKKKKKSFYNLVSSLKKNS